MTNERRLRVLEADPENAEAGSREAFRDLLTSRANHYVRNHYPTPDIDASEWTMSVTGAGADGELTLAELREDYPTETVGHTMECSGNGRAFFEPEAGEHQWTVGALGTAVWTGTPVSAVLDDHGAEGSWLAAMGGDAPEGEEVFCRSIPMAKIRADCLLAYGMNGEPLPPEHGFPVRLVVPGWFGNNSVKWVDRIHAMDGMVAGEEWAGYTKYQQESYRILAEGDEPAEHRSVEEFDTWAQMRGGEVENAYMFDQLVKSVIDRPADGATLSVEPGETVEITGAAWGGKDTIERVEVSADGGESWGDADLFEPALGRHAWRRFACGWRPEPGEHELLCRATDVVGRTQPATISSPDEGRRDIEDDEYPWNEKGYGNNAYRTLGITVTVEEEGR